jgi:hypothetical protein
MLKARENVVRFSAEAKDFPFLQNSQTDSEVHHIFHSVGNRGYFPEGTAADA